MVVKSGRISVGQKQMDRFSLVIRFRRLFWLTLKERERRWERKTFARARVWSCVALGMAPILTCSGEWWRIWRRRSFLEGTCVARPSWCGDAALDHWFLQGGREGTQNETQTHLFSSCFTGVHLSHNRQIVRGWHDAHTGVSLDNGLKVWRPSRLEQTVFVI